MEIFTTIIIISTFHVEEQNRGSCSLFVGEELGTLMAD
jgi:hypothetical protein